MQTAHRKKVLIAGSGVAGASLAHFLHRDGHSVTMIDVSPEPEEGGFVLQLNHDAMRIVRQLGAERQVKEAGEAARRMTARFGRGRSKVDVPISVGAAITMRRGDLARVLIEHAEQDVSLQSGVGITAIRQEVGRAVAYLTDGRAEDFDVIVGADGLHSTVRKLTVGHDDDIYRNGLKNIWFTVPYPMAPDERSVVFQHGRDVVQVLPFPGRRETLVIVTTHDLGPAHQDEQQLRARAAQAIARSAPAYLRPLSSAVHDSEKVKVTAFQQVRLDSWHHQQTVLLGDSAYCIDPLSGLGAHASLLGARLLSRALVRHHDAPTPRPAFRAYERALRPWVRSMQHLTANADEFLTGQGFTHGLSRFTATITALAGTTKGVRLAN